MAQDPICNMEVDENNHPGGTVTYEGQTYYFCSPECRQLFETDEENYPGQAA